MYEDSEGLAASLAVVAELIVRGDDELAQLLDHCRLQAAPGRHAVCRRRLDGLLGGTARVASGAAT